MLICCASQFLEWQRGVVFPDCHGDNNYNGDNGDNNDNGDNCDNGDNGEHERANLLVSLMPICCLESELLLVKLMVS